MKKIINKLIFIFALLPLLAGCEKDKEIVVVEPVENYTQLYGLGTIFSWDSNVPTELKLIEQNTFTISNTPKRTSNSNSSSKRETGTKYVIWYLPQQMMVLP